MNVKKLIGINREISNVFRVSLPYWWVINEKAREFSENFEKKNVVFFGSDMNSFIQAGVDRGYFIERYNECLDYIRRKFNGYDLYYKPHPADEVHLAGEAEQSFLDLKGFDIVKEKTTAELFLWKNQDRIKTVFSIASFSAANAYSMGLDSHVFYKCFSEVFRRKLTNQQDDFFFEMPQPFFITNLEQETIDNSRTLKRNELLESGFKEILNDNNGKVWFIISATEYVVALVAMAKLVRNLDPTRKIGLIISRHHRWDVINPDYYKEYFDKIVVLPRIHYSLRPKKLLLALKTAWQIRDFKISPGDILISFSQVEFVENCFLSYYKKNLRIGLVMNRDFNMHYNSQSLTYSENDDFRFSKASWFYNKILEPLLGLSHSLFMFYTPEEGPCCLTRYQKPINEIFDRVYIMNNI